MGRINKDAEIEAKVGKPIYNFLTDAAREGKKPADIAQEAGVALSTIYELIKRFNLRDKFKEGAKKMLYTRTGSELKSVIDDYLRAKEVSGRSPKTLENYKGSLYQFLWWLQETNRPAVTGILENEVTLNDYLYYLKTEPVRFGGKVAGARKPMQASSINTHFTTMKAFQRWCEKKELIKKAGIMKLDRPKVQKRLPEDVPDEILARILNSFDESFVGIRNKTIVMTFLDTGLRLDGCVNLEADQFDLETGWGQIIEKGDKERRIHLSTNALAQLKKYLVLRDPVARTNKLWINQDGEHFGRGPIKVMVRELNEYSDVKHNIHPHVFRHIWCKYLAINKVNPLDGKLMGGWADIQLYMYYSSAYTSAEAWTEHDRVSPITKLLGKGDGNEQSEANESNENGKE